MARYGSDHVAYRYPKKGFSETCARFIDRNSIWGICSLRPFFCGRAAQYGRSARLIKVAGGAQYTVRAFW